MPTTPAPFQVTAEYLNQFIGRRAAIRFDGRPEGIPFTVDAVRLDPDRARIIVDVGLPIPNSVVTFEFDPSTLIDIQHERSAA